MRRLTLYLVTALALAASSSTAAIASSGSSDKPQARDSIVITANKHFDAEHGVRSGKGTAKDPYVISGWNLHHLEIKDTSKHVIIRNNSIPGTLVLDWIGNGVHLHNNTIGDLRVNQNVKRTGDMTSGVISHNKFGIVGQLRHWDGVFAHNQVGNPDSCSDLPFYSCRAVNFDGFNGSHFRNNNIFGYVEVRLHGHHHSSGFNADHSHYHGSEHADMVDHTKRYHQVWVTNNTIHSGDYYGLLFTDSNHAGNDRTAASETNPDLNKPHVHKTKVHLNNNRVFGSGIEINIFNANDERHLGTKTGFMEIKGNTVHVQPEEMQVEELFSYRDGIVVSRAQDLKLSIAGNRIDGALPDGDQTAVVKEQFDNGAGISLWDIDKARVRIMNNLVMDRTYGVRASSMSDSVRWWVGGLKTRDVEQDVYYDGSVENEPRKRK